MTTSRPRRLLAVLCLFGLAPLAVPGKATGQAASPDAGTFPAILHVEPLPAAERTAAVERLETAVREWSESDEDPRWAHAADSALATLPALADWRPLLFAELLAPSGDTAGVRQALAALDRTDDYWIRWGWVAWVDALEAAEDFTGAAEAARFHARERDGSSDAATAWARAGRAALEAGDTVAAREDLQLALEYGPGVGGARDAARTLDDLSADYSPEQEVAIGLALLEAGVWGRAVARLEPHLESDLVSDPNGTVRLDLGRALYETRRYAEAGRMLAPLLGESTDLDVATPARYWEGLARLSAGNVAGAESMFRLIAATDPEHRYAEDGLYRLFSRELDTGFGPRARGYLSELLAVGVSNTDIGTTLVRLGTDDYLGGDYAGAAAFFEDFLLSGRTTALRQQAGYWAALAHAAVGDQDAANTLLTTVAREDPFTFYGALSGERVDAPVLDAALTEGPPPNPELEAPLSNAIARVAVMEIVPTPGSLVYELGRITEYVSQHPAGRYDMAEAFIDGGLALRAIVIGRDIQRDEGDWNLRLLRIVHPFPHREAVVRQATSLGLNPFLVAGVIRQESAWDASIASSAGAIGLMQLMPPTAREVAGSLGVSYSEDVLRDPETNVTFGTTYLASMVRRFERVEAVLSAYNAGPGRMRQWEGQAAYRDTDVFTEQIPFEETRNYVKSIQRYARIYAALYGCGQFEPCLGLPYRSIVAANPAALGAPRIYLD